MKILLTGSNGFIGKNMKLKMEQDYDIDTPTRKDLELTNFSAVEAYIKKGNYDLVIHAANINNSRNLTTSPYEVLQGNLLMFYNLVKCQKLYKRMIYFGSGAEYDSRAYIPNMKEEFFGENIPQDAYGLSKYIMAKETEHNENIYDFRLLGVYGPYEEWEHRFISNAICRALKGLPITINQNVYFDYLWIEDLIEIVKKLMNKELRYKHYNICSGQRIDLLSLAEMVNEVVGNNSPIMIKQEGLKREYTADNSRMMKVIENFNFTCYYDTIEKLVAFYKECIDSIDESKL